MSITEFRYRLEKAGPTSGVAFVCDRCKMFPAHLSVRHHHERDALVIRAACHGDTTIGLIDNRDLLANANVVLFVAEDEEAMTIPSSAKEEEMY